MSLPALLIIYVIFAAGVIFSASKASNYVDEIDNKTNIGGALIGGVLLAGVTSLPEFVASLTSTITGEPGLAYGNIYGSNVFNIVILAIMDIIFVNKFFLRDMDKSNKKTNLYVLGLYIVTFIPMALSIFVFTDMNNPFMDPLLSFGLLAIIILVVYAINIYTTGNNESSEISNSAKPSNTTGGLRGTIIKFAITALVLVLLSIGVTETTARIVDITNMDSSFAGALFLGIATSLPELTAVYTLFKLGNKEAAVGNVVGSNLFNLAILATVDIITIDENLFNAIIVDAELRSSVALLIFVGLFNLIILTFMFTRKKESKNKFLYLLPSLLIIFNYLLYVWLSI